MEQTLIGTIIKGVGGLYTVRLQDTASEHTPPTVLARAKGAFRHEHISPLVGDSVLLLREESGEEQFVIRDILQRKNCLIRPPLANLDLLFCTVAAASPAPILPTLDKLISIAEFHRIEPVILVTKADLDPDTAENIANIYRQGGFSVFVLNALLGEGCEELRAFINDRLPRRIAAVAGASGIGKSTLLNSLFPSLGLETSSVSRKTERGRHTTRHVELYPLSEAADCGFLADTPGFSLLDFERFDFFTLDDLPHTMREFAPHLGNCRYTKCSHTAEQGCAVLEAMRRGEIAPSRHESYCELYRTLKAKKKW